MLTKRVNLLSKHYGETAVVLLKDPSHYINGQASVAWYNFVWNQKIEYNDIIVVMDYPKEHIINTTHTTTILWQSEPINIYNFPLSYINKFDYIISALPKTHTTKTKWINWLSICAFHSFLHHESYEKLIYNNTKNKTISLVTSDLTIIPEHRKRVDFVQFLKEKQESIDILWFNKKIYFYDGFKDYKYTIVLENTRQENHFTEKLTDALRSWCFVFYYGCSNIKNYFDMNSIVEIDITDMQDSLDKINSYIKENSYEENITSIQKNKEKALSMNYFSYLAQILKENNIQPYTQSESRSIIIDHHDSPVYALWRKRYYYQFQYILKKQLKKYFLS